MAITSLCILTPPSHYINPPQCLRVSSLNSVSVSVFVSIEPFAKPVMLWQERKYLRCVIKLPLLMEVTEAIIQESLRLCSERCPTSRSQLDTCPPPISLLLQYERKHVRRPKGPRAVMSNSMCANSPFCSIHKPRVMISECLCSPYEGHNAVASLDVFDSLYTI